MKDKIFFLGKVNCNMLPNKLMMKDTYKGREQDQPYTYCIC